MASEGQVVQGHGLFHEVALCVLGGLQPGEDGPQDRHH